MTCLASLSRMHAFTQRCPVAISRRAPGLGPARHLDSDHIGIRIDDRRLDCLLVAPRRGVVNLDGKNGELRRVPRNGGVR